MPQTPTRIKCRYCDYSVTRAYQKGGKVVMGVTRIVDHVERAHHDRYVAEAKLRAGSCKTLPLDLTSTSGGAVKVSSSCR